MKPTGQFWEYLFTTGDLDKTLDTFLVIGVQSRVGRNKHIILLDYDNVSLRSIETEIKKIRSIFDLKHPFYIFQTTPGNYGVISFNVVPFKVYKMIMEKCSIDKKFIRVTKRNKQGTLRFTPKGYQEDSNLELKHIIGEETPNELKDQVFSLWRCENAQTKI